MSGGEQPASGEERQPAVERALRREQARLRRVQARVAGLRRAARRPQAAARARVGRQIGDGQRAAASGGEVVGRLFAGDASEEGEAAAAQLRVGPLALDRQAQVALVAAGAGQRRAALTSSEVRLLALLMERPGRVLSCRDLAREALGYNVVEAEAVEIVRPHISRLRQKLEPDPLQRRLIRTVRGQGYLFSP